MAWLPIEQNLSHHPKILRLAGILRQHPRYVVGLMVEVWGWALDSSPDGNIGERRDWLAQAVGFQENGTKLLEALQEAGLVDANGHLHGWSEWSGKLAEKRRKDAERKRGQRTGGPAPPPHLSEDDPTPRAQPQVPEKPKETITPDAVIGKATGMWQSVLSELVGQIPPTNFVTWFRDTSMERPTEDEFVVVLPNDFAATFVRDHYLRRVVMAVAKVSGYEEPTLGLKVRGQDARFRMPEELS